MRFWGFFLILTVFALPAFAGATIHPPVKPERTGAQKTALSAGKVENESEGGYAQNYIGEMEIYSTVYEDTMVAIARTNDLGFVELQVANPDVDPWLPGEGVEMILPKQHLLPKGPHEGIVINLPEMRLYYYPEKDGKPESFPIGIGREGLKTPTGKTYVRAKKEGPTWRPTKRMRDENPELPEAVPPGPENPLGTHILYLGWPEYGIHGTNKPYGIGRRVSSGCIRMYPEDIVDLYPAVPEGAPVTVLDQPVKAAWIGDQLYVEAHPTMDQADRTELEGAVPTYEMSDKDMALIVDTAGRYYKDIDWSLVRRIIRQRSGYPIPVAKRPDSEGSAVKSGGTPDTESMSAGPEKS